ncbi:MAG: group 1 truncated hemoglobin [Proteobacteria bacterium]|nr:group 1 truncated hemoglobin [Pseudomonadota bacterium]
MTQTFYEELGGRPCLEKVHVLLYDKLLSHPWLKEFFAGNDRWHLEIQQTDFMQGLFGGPHVYGGRIPRTAHVHIFITEEVFMIRHRLLEQALTEAGIRQAHKERWLDFDMGFIKALVKTDVSECEGRYKTEAVIAMPKP